MMKKTRTHTQTAYMHLADRNATRGRLIRDDEVTIAQACRIIGVPATETARYLREKQVPFSKARPDEMFLTEPERVYLRADVEAVAPDYDEHQTLKFAGLHQRSAERLAVARAARKAKAEDDARSPYVSLDEAASLTGRSIDDPLFDELPFIHGDGDGDAEVNTSALGWMGILGAHAKVEPVTTGRMYARDDLAPYLVSREQEDPMKVAMRETLARFTQQAAQARQWQMKNGARLAA